jgi:antitoxin component of MazEF toxin-antitoxin module
VVKQLTRNGDALTLVIPAAIAERMGVDENTPLTLRVEGRELTVAPADRGENADFATAVAESHRRFGNAYKKLAE